MFVGGPGSARRRRGTAGQGGKQQKGTHTRTRVRPCSQHDTSPSGAAAGGNQPDARLGRVFHRGNLCNPGRRIVQCPLRRARCRGSAWLRRRGCRPGRRPHPPSRWAPDAVPPGRPAGNPLRQNETSLRVETIIASAVSGFGLAVRAGGSDGVVVRNGPHMERACGRWHEVGGSDMPPTNRLCHRQRTPVHCVLRPRSAFAPWRPAGISQATR